MTSTSTDRRQGVNAGAAFKVPVRVATTAAINLSTIGLGTIDGVVLASGDRVLVKNQASSIENGIYVATTGAWARDVDADGTFDLKNGSLVEVNSGTVNARLVYVCTAADPITIGTSAITWQAMNPGTPITVPVSVAQGGTGGTTETTGAAGLGRVELTGAGGTANAQTANSPATFTAFRAGQLFTYTPAVTNTGAVTLAVTGGAGLLAARNVFYDAAACAGGELVANEPTLLLDDGTRLHIVGYSRKIRTAQLGAASGLINGVFQPTQNGTQLTVAIKTFAGADPSAADPVGVIFRSVTATVSDYTVIWLTAATSITTTVGGTFGVANSVAFRLWLVAFNDAGVVRLALINCLTTVANSGAGRDVTAIYPLAQFGIASSTLIGAGSTSAGVFYSSGAGVASKAYTVLGYITYESGLAVAGTFGVNHSRGELFRQGVPLPGQTIQYVPLQYGTVATGSTTMPSDNTIPQNTEGDQHFSQTITANSAANCLRISVREQLSGNAADILIQTALFVDATANALAATQQECHNNGGSVYNGIECMRLAGATTAQNFKTRTGPNSAATVTWNGIGGTQLYGGVSDSFMELKEVMG